MKKSIFGLFLAATFLFACNKSASDSSSVSLTASTTEAAVGQTITVTANTRTNSLSWSVNPSISVTKAYSVTTEKTNYISFSQPGSYVVGVRARDLQLDSVHQCNHADSTGIHHVQDSTWNHHIDSLWINHGFHKGGCKNGQDSASIRITVK
jgi:hypothetical protein